MATIGLINPGAMGASVGAAAAGNGHQVLWASEGRSKATRERAARAGLSDSSSLARLVAASQIILSICPPDQAINVAEQVARCGFTGLYVDANAISPGNTQWVASTLASAEFVDGGIIGGPAWKPESGTRLYLSGASAGEIAALFSGSPLTASVISADIGAASALKMCFAAYTKGTSALLGAILAVAETQGVRAALQAQWGDDFTRQTVARVRASSAKAWRFTGEMREIAATFESAGLPGGFHQGAASVYERLSQFKDADPYPELDDILRGLINQGDPS